MMSAASFNFFRGFKIYTRTGDKGTTFLNSKIGRLPKHSQIFNVLGDIDELSCSIGMVIDNPKIAQEVKETLINVQIRLQDINSILASDPDAAGNEKLNTLDGQVDLLEKNIDNYSEGLKPLRSFILPSGGGQVSTQLHVSRAICRRAERSLCSLLSEELMASSGRFLESEKYLNRLSDLLFVAARYTAIGPVTEYSSKTTK